MPSFSFAVLPDRQLERFVQMAHSVVKECRWHEFWREGMRLFIAHFATLYVSSSAADDSPAAIASAGAARGMVSSKSVEDVSVSYDLSTVLSDLDGWGAWKETIYGEQFATYARRLGMGGMYIR